MAQSTQMDLRCGLAVVLLLFASPATAGASDLRGPLSHERLRLAAEAAGFRVESLSADIPAAVHSRFAFTPIEYDNPLLVELRRNFPLETLTSDSRDEFEAQLRLKDWVFRQVPGGTPRSDPRTAAEILRLAARGEAFWCTYFSIVYIQCAQALGWQARHAGVDRRHGPAGMQSTHHGVAEIWSNQFRKWYVVDAQSNLHFEKARLPLSAWEIRAEWIRDKGAAVDHVVGCPPQTVKKNPAMVWPVPDEDEIATYFWLYIEDRADFAGQPAKQIFPQDDANAKEIWYQNNDETGRGQLHQGYLKNRFVPTSRLEDAYWTVGVVEAELTEAAAGGMRLNLASYCPDLIAYEVARNGSGWEQVGSVLEWRLEPGWNTLRLRTLGQGGVLGPETAVAMYLSEAKEAP